MKGLLAGTLVLIFSFLSVIHFYWMFGGRFGSQSVFPTKNESVSPKMPGPIPTFIVALGLLSIVLLILFKADLFLVKLPASIDRYGLRVVAAIFILRAVGDFNYVGFFKKIKQTKFGLNDTKYYSPLCFVTGVLLILFDYAT
jgi:hypothetical protein